MPEEKNQNQQSQTPSSKPAWLLKYKKMVKIFDIINMAFEDDCNCRACNELKEYSKDLEQEMLAKLRF